MVTAVPAGALAANRLIGVGSILVIGDASSIRPRSLAPRRERLNCGSLNVAFAITTVPTWLITSSVLRWTRVFAVTWSCELKPSTAGSTQCPAVMTQLGVTSVPVHRLLSTMIATTDGYSPAVVVVPPMIDTGAGPSAQ